MPHFGLIVLNKPERMSSRQAVDRVKPWVRPAKLGHAGTLDPLATGVLVVCIGRATRLIDYVQAMWKSYTATFLLGQHSETDDLESPAIEMVDAPQPTRVAIEAALSGFLGTIDQRPPDYSAVKVDGRRAYALARKGHEFELETRPIEIHRLEIVEYAYPALTLSIECGSGTYVRSLGRDIAAALGTCAVMSALVRTATGPFTLEGACDPRMLTAADLPRYLQPALRIVEHLPRVTLTENECRRIANGLSVPAREPTTEGEIAALDPSGRLLAILVPRGGELGPVRYFPPGDSA